MSHTLSSNSKLLIITGDLRSKQRSGDVTRIGSEDAMAELENSIDGFSLVHSLGLGKDDAVQEKPPSTAKTGVETP